MPEAWFEASADAELTRLDADPGMRGVAERFHELIDILETDPADVRVRRRRFQSGFWAVTFAGSEQEWLLLWEEHPSIVGDVVVAYIGAVNSL